MPLFDRTVELNRPESRGKKMRHLVEEGKHFSVDSSPRAGAECGDLQSEGREEEHDDFM